MTKVVVNSDKEIVKEIRDKIRENGGHCACAITFNQDNVCICKEFRDQIERGEEGECHCGLYKIIIQNS